jgi:hypothetical protein
VVSSRVLSGESSQFEILAALFPEFENFRIENIMRIVVSQGVWLWPGLQSGILQSCIFGFKHYKVSHALYGPMAMGWTCLQTFGGLITGLWGKVVSDGVWKFGAWDLGIFE